MKDFTVGESKKAVSKWSEEGKKRHGEKMRAFWRKRKEQGKRTEICMWYSDAVKKIFFFS